MSYFVSYFERVVKHSVVCYSSGHESECVKTGGPPHAQNKGGKEGRPQQGIKGHDLVFFVEDKAKYS